MPYSDRDSELAAGGSRDHLAKGDQIGVAPLIEPFSADDIFLVKVSEMGDRPAERADPEFACSGQDLQGIPERFLFDKTPWCNVVKCLDEYNVNGIMRLRRNYAVTSGPRQSRPGSRGSP